MAEPRYSGTAKPDFRLHIISSQILYHPPVSTRTGMGRAVAASYLKEIENRRFGTWDEREWWIKGWPTDWEDEREKEYKTPLSFVTFQWKFFISEIWEDKKQLVKAVI